MIRGLVFGKYYPFHIGHKAKIEFALEHCDELFIIVCASDKENIDAKTRSSWIQSEIESSNISVLPFDYRESELPNTSESSIDVSRVWSDQFMTMTPKIDVLITSEKYGEYVAEYLNCQHLMFDNDRTEINISATEIRKDIIKNWDFLPSSVRSYFQMKVCFLGTECTGKSSISSALSSQLNTQLVTEAGRDLIDDSNEFSQSDLYKVSEVHSKRIKQAEDELEPLILIDTDIHITQSYSKFMFGSYLDIDEEIYDNNKADIYFYLDASLPYVQDGTRLDKIQRDLLDKNHQKTFKEFQLNYHSITGNWEERLINCKEIIQKEIEAIFNK